MLKCCPLNILEYSKNRPLFSFSYLQKSTNTVQCTLYLKSLISIAKNLGYYSKYNDAEKFKKKSSVYKRNQNNPSEIKT